MNTANKHRKNTVLHTKKGGGGFTIIEVMLFLGVSSVLFIALMIGVGTTINQQRYRDSIESFVGTIQTQFFKVSNTDNDRGTTWRCANSIVEIDPEADSPRGTSRCVILGRFIHTIENARKIEMGYIIGNEPASSVVIDSDASAFQAYLPRASEFNKTVYEPEWGAVLRNEEGNPASFSILIVRSPLSGLIRTYASNSPMPANLQEMMNEDTARSRITACVVSEDWINGSKQAVIIDAATSGPSSVYASGDSTSC